MTKLRFEVTWRAGAVPHRLSLVDNGWDVTADPSTNTDGFALEWDADDRNAHMLCWELHSDEPGLHAVVVRAGWSTAPLPRLSERTTAPAHWSDFAVVSRRALR